jgi:hypothetical protein
MNDIPHSAEPVQSVAQLGESLAQTAENHRALFQEITGFAKDESLRFVNLRLERNGVVLDKLQNCQGVPGLIGVQQEWLRDFLQDYASQSMRMMGAVRGLAKNVMEAAAENAADNIDRMQRGAHDLTRQAEDVVYTEDMGHHIVQQADDQMSNIVQDTNNNYVQH